MDEVLISLAKLSPIVGLLLAIVYWQNKRVENYEKAGAVREAEMHASCAKREERLASRLNQLEDRQHTQMAQALAATAETQKITAESSRTFSRALDRWTDATGSGSGGHRI